MHDTAVDPEFMKDLLARIREGLVEGVRQEVERCRRLGLPLYVARNGKIEVLQSFESQVDKG